VETKAQQFNRRNPTRRAMIAAIHLSDEHTPQPIPPVDDDDDDDDDKSKPGSGGGNIDPDDDEGDSDDDDDDEDETLWSESRVAANEVTRDE
jgi:U3 small nucleolar RNA-associated protein 14